MRIADELTINLKIAIHLFLTNLSRKCSGIKAHKYVLTSVNVNFSYTVITVNCIRTAL